MTNREKLIKFYYENLEQNCITVIQLVNKQQYVMVGTNLFVLLDNRGGFMQYKYDDLSAEYIEECSVKAAYAYPACYGVVNLPSKPEATLVFDRTVELTLDQIAQKFGVSVESLKIKK